MTITNKSILFVFIVVLSTCKKEEQPPNAPVATSATNVTKASFTANWSAVNGVTQYGIDLSNDNFISFFAGFENYPATGTSINFSGLDLGKTYQYRVKTLSGSHPSPYSNTITVVLLPPIPDTPVARAATFIKQTSFAVTWDISSGYTDFRLDVSKDNFTSFVPGYNNLTVPSTVTVIDGLTPGTTYQYRVRASNSFGVSPNSNVIVATTLDPVPELTFANGTGYYCQVGSTTCSNPVISSIPNGGSIAFSVDNTTVATVNSTTGAMAPLTIGTAIVTATQSPKAGVNVQGIAAFSFVVVGTSGGGGGGANCSGITSFVSVVSATKQSYCGSGNNDLEVILRNNSSQRLAVQICLQHSNLTWDNGVMDIAPGKTSRYWTCNSTGKYLYAALLWSDWPVTCNFQTCK